MSPGIVDTWGFFLNRSEKGIYNVYTLGGSQDVLFLTENGVYEVLMLSRKPIARNYFWCCRVQPVQRCTGRSYISRNSKAHEWTEEELKRLQLVLMKNQVNQGTQVSIVKSTVETGFQSGLTIQELKRLQLVLMANTQKQ